MAVAEHFAATMLIMLLGNWFRSLDLIHYSSPSRHSIGIKREINWMSWSTVCYIGRWWAVCGWVRSLLDSDAADAAMSTFQYSRTCTTWHGITDVHQQQTALININLRKLTYFITTATTIAMMRFNNLTKTSKDITLSSFVCRPINLMVRLTLL